jgi:hypothetical protein
MHRPKKNFSDSNACGCERWDWTKRKFHQRLH